MEQDDGMVKIYLNLDFVCKYLLVVFFFVFTGLLFTGCGGSGVKRVGMFGFFVEKGGKYVYERNSYSYGVVRSSYSLLRYLKGYEVVEPVGVNFGYGDYVGMVRSNVGMDFYITGEYRLVEGKVRYVVNIHDGRGIVIWSGDLGGGIGEEELFGVADEMAVMCANVLNDKASGIGSLSFKVVEGSTNLISIMLNRQVVYDRVVGGFSGVLSLISGVEYLVEVVDSDGGGVLSSGNVVVERDKRSIVSIGIEGDLVVEGVVIEDRRRFYIDLGVGSLGMGVVGFGYELGGGVSLEFGVGDSVVVFEDGEMYNKLSVGFGGRYVGWGGSWGNLGVFSKLYGSYYDGGIRNVGVGMGIGYSVWLINLDLGLGVGLIDFSDFFYGPYWKFSVKF